jgi:Pex2 / Pex12 amino terminal region
MEEPSAAASNPASPNSLGALLAEEWTINPYSTLPSFVEHAMMAEASRSTYQFIGTAMSTVEHALRQQLLMGIHPSRFGDADENESSSVARRRWWDFLRRLQRRLLQRAHSVRRTAIVSAESILRQYKLELQYLAVYIMERQSLLRYGGVVSETLYGAKRVKLGRVADEGSGESPSVKRALEPLSRTDATRLALLTALLPYLHEKSNQLMRRRLYSPSPVLATSLQWRAQLLPMVQTALALVDLYCRWSYLMGRSVHYDVLSLALQHVVRRVTEQDKRASSSSPPTAGADDLKEGQGGTSSRESRDSSLPASEKGAQLARQSLLYMMAGTLAVSWLTQVRHAFVTYRRNQAMREYQRHLQRQEQQPSQPFQSIHEAPSNVEGDATENGTDGSPPSWWSGSPDIPPPPPAVPLPNENGVPTGACPLCRRVNRRKPTASSSGYVFCFTCILDYIQRHRKCPITGGCCKETDLIRLYEPEPTQRNTNNSY